MAKKFEWIKCAKKILISALAIVIAGGASYYGENQIWLLLVPVFVGLQNYIKHR